jgi:hypothetical protein
MMPKLTPDVLFMAGEGSLLSKVSKARYGPDANYEPSTHNDQPAHSVFDLESDPLNRRSGEQKMRSNQVALLVTIICAAIPASAQSLCELVPAAVVQSTLGISVTLTAAPNTQGGNGCDYKGASTGPITLTADTISDAGMYTSACIA